MPRRASTVRLDATAHVDLVLAPLHDGGSPRLGEDARPRPGLDDDRNELHEPGHFPAAGFPQLCRHRPREPRRLHGPWRHAGKIARAVDLWRDFTENQWIIDGVNTTDVFKGIQGKAINNEFVQEVEVKTGGYQAEYGRALGGFVNVITKSGGNAVPRGAFLYYDSTGPPRRRRCSRPTTREWPQMRVADGSRFDYGADLGGFILKDRLWIFGAFDRVEFRGNLSRVESSPLRFDGGSLSARLDGESLLGKADLERRGFDLPRGLRLRGPVHDLGRGRRRSASGPGRRLRARRS